MPVEFSERNEYEYMICCNQYSEINAVNGILNKDVKIQLISNHDHAIIKTLQAIEHLVMS